MVGDIHWYSMTISNILPQIFLSNWFSIAPLGIHRHSTTSYEQIQNSFAKPWSSSTQKNIPQTLFRWIWVTIPNHFCIRYIKYDIGNTPSKMGFFFYNDLSAKAISDWNWREFLASVFLTVPVFQGQMDVGGRTLGTLQFNQHFHHTSTSALLQNLESTDLWIATILRLHICILTSQDSQRLPLKKIQGRISFADLYS